MSTDSRLEDASLPVPALERIDRICLEFESAWKAGKPASIEDCLGHTQGKERSQLLYELVLLDLDYRREREQRPPADEYHRRFPHETAAIDSAFASATGKAAGSVEADATREAPPSPQTPLPEKIGKYRVVERLGRGGQAELFRAVHPELANRDVVIKWAHRRLSEANRQILLEEARVLARLDDPGVARVYDVDVHQGRPFAVVEYVEGPSLKEELKRGLPTPRQAATQIAALAGTLDRVHRQGILHRDLKPANILLDTQGRPRLLDFGLAWWARSGDEECKRAGGISGTPQYMPPEQARGETGRAGPWTDVFGLAAVLYEMLTGRPPYQGSNPKEVLERARRAQIVPPRRLGRRVPRALQRICMKALDADPKRRYQSSAQLQRALRGYLRRRTMAVVAATVCLAAVAVSLAAYYGNWGRQPTLGPLLGDLEAQVWSEHAEFPKPGLKLEEPGAVPVRADELVHLQVKLQQPAYIYLLWVSSQGKVIPVYPWDPQKGWRRPQGQEHPRRELHSPDRLDEGWPVDEHPGLESVVLLARRTPLPEEVDLGDLLGQLPPVGFSHPCETTWWELNPELENVRLQRSLHYPKRGIDLIPQRINDPLLKRVQDLREHFELIKVVRFAHVGKP